MCQTFSRLLRPGGTAEFQAITGDGSDATIDVRPQFCAEFFNAQLNVLSGDRRGERLVLEFLSNALGGHPFEPSRPNKCTGNDESSEFIYCKERSCHGGFAGNAAVWCVPEDRFDDSLIHIGVLLQVGNPHERMLLLRGVLFVVEVVQETRDSPSIPLRLIAITKGPHARRHALHVLAKRWILNPLVHQRSGSFGRHRMQDTRPCGAAAASGFVYHHPSGPQRIIQCHEESSPAPQQVIVCLSMSRNGEAYVDEAIIDDFRRKMRRQVLLKEPL